MRRCVLILAATLVACTRDPNVLKKRYLEAGDRYFDKRQYREASIMYRTALRKDQRYAEAYYRNALALIRLKQFGPAGASLRRALELLPEGPERVASRVQLSDIYLAYIESVTHDRNLMQETSRLCEEILALDTKSFDGRRLRGMLSNLEAAELSAKHPTEAAEELRSAIADLRMADSILPYKPEVVSALSRALWASRQPEEAEKYLKGVLQAKPTLASAYSELNRFYTKTGRLKDAEEILKSAVENLPNHYEFAAQLAEFYQKTGRPTDMARILDQLKAQSKGQLAAYELAGRLFLKAGEPEKAIREFEDGTRKSPKDKLVFQKLTVDALMVQNRKAEAIKLNDDILRERPDDADALSRQADYSLGNGDVAKAIASLESILRRAPDHALTHYNLGRALLATGRREEARVQFSETIRWNPDFIPARLALTKVHIATGEFGAAVLAADEILAIDHGHGEARALRVIALRSLGKLDDARAEVKKLLGMYPLYDEGLFQLGEIAAAERKWKDAEAAYLKSYRANPRNLEGLLALADLKLRRNEAGAALATLKAEVNNNPERLDLRILYGSIASRAGRTEEAAAEFKLLLTKLGQNPIALGDVNLRLGELFFRTGATQQALPYLEKARQLRPNDPTALHSLGVVYDVLGRKKEAAAVYEASLKINGENPVVMNNLAYYISQNGGDLDQALTLAQRARQGSPNVPAYADTVAFIYLKKNLVENALEILEELVQKSPKDATFRAHLGEALLKKGETARAMKELQSALSAKPTADEAARIKELLSKRGG